jgi:hypothetical protein
VTFFTILQRQKIFPGLSLHVFGRQVATFRVEFCKIRSDFYPENLYMVKKKVKKSIIFIPSEKTIKKFKKPVIEHWELRQKIE